MPTYTLAQRLAVDYRTTVRTIYRHKKHIDTGYLVACPVEGPRIIITWPIEQAIKAVLDKQP